jgi:hypothetical protein
MYQASVWMFVVRLIDAVDSSFSVTRPTRTCSASQTYFATIDECIANSISSQPSFLEALLLTKRCPGGVIRTAEQLEGLRFCHVINGSLVLNLDSPSTNFTSALFDIETITGVRLLVMPCD